MPMFSGELKSILWYSPADGRDIKVPQDGFHAPKALATIKYRFLKKKKTFWCDRTKPRGRGGRGGGLLFNLNFSPSKSKRDASFNSLHMVSVFLLQVVSFSFILKMNNKV